MGKNYVSYHKQASKELDARKKRMLTAIGMAGASHVKMLTPVDTGALRNSIDYKTDDKGVMIGSTLTSEDYPLFLELGTSNDPDGQPYLRPGIMNNLINLRQVALKNFK